MTIERKKTKKGTKYLARVRIPHTNKRKSVGTYCSRNDAEAAVERALENLQSGSGLHGDIGKGATSFKKFVEEVYLKSLNVSPSTKNDYEISCRRLTAYFGSRPLSQISREDIDKFNSSMQLKSNGEPYSANYRRKTAQRLRQIFTTAVSYGYITAQSHPYQAGIGGAGKLPARPKESTRAILHYGAARRILSILKTASEQTDDPWWAMEAEYWNILLGTALVTGMRRSELLGLQTSDLNAQDCTIEITRQWGWSADSNSKWIAPKTKYGSRTIPLTQNDFDFVYKWAEYVKQTESPDSLLFPRPHSRELGEWDYWRSPSYFSKSYKKVLERVYGIYVNEMNEQPWEKIPYTEEQMVVKMHDWRHTFSVFLLTEAMVDVNTVSRWLGHHSPSFTYEVYSRYIESERESAVDKVRKAYTKKRGQQGLFK